MYYPTLTEIPTTRQTVDVFGGYNHNLRIGDGEFYDMKNLTSSNYPVLTPRRKRGLHTKNGEPVRVMIPNGLVCKDYLCHIDGEYFYIDGYQLKDFKLDPKTEKTIVSMGSYVVIFPDKKWVNTSLWDGNSFNNSEGDGWGNIDAELSSKSTTFTLCKADGTSYENTNKGVNPPSNPTKGTLWLDTSSSPHSLKIYSESNGTWSSVATTYIKVALGGIGMNFNDFKEGDSIQITGIEHAYKNGGLEDGGGAVIEDDNISEQLLSLEGSAIVKAKGNNYIVVVGILDERVTTNSEITFSRKSPDMDFVVESQNRLWGCKYGVVKDFEKPVNEIYACKLGDFTNWNCFVGISTDSYVASCGTDGEFTGAASHLGYPVFFKENCMHKVYGNYPANYQIQETNCNGVQKGCDKSIATVNEMLYYKSRTGVMVYDGSFPANISLQLGTDLYYDAIASSLGNKYYISMHDVNGKYSLFAYDTQKGLWHKEDNTHIKFITSNGEEVYFIKDGETVITTLTGSGKRDTDPVEWMAETGILSVANTDKKYISRLNVKMSLDISSSVDFYIQYDSTGGWEHVATVRGTSLKTFTAPIRPRRCDHFRLKIVGKGHANIYGLTKTLESGSDV